MTLAWVLVLILACGAGSAAVAGEADSLRTHGKQESLRTVVVTNGDSVASMTVPLQRWTGPAIFANAVSMSLGPLINEGADTTTFLLDGRRVRFDDLLLRRLRVTISTSETSMSMLIDDIRIGRADSRQVIGSYQLNPYGGFNTRGLWSALSGAPRVLGSAPEEPAIRWLSPTSFAWINRADTLVVEQIKGSTFTITAKARVR